MDLFNTILVCLLGLSVLHTAECGCKEEKMSDRSFVESCMTPFGKFFSEAAAAGQNIMQAMCTKEGKAAMACIFDAIKTCPKLLQSQDGGAGMPPGLNFTQILQQGGMDTFCDIVPGGKCAEVIACANNSESLFKMADIKGHTPFENYQSYVHVMCRDVKTMLMCFDNAPAECADIVKLAKQQVPQFAEVRRYITERCPRVPTYGIVLNKCVKDKIESDAFVECYRPFERAYGSLNNDGPTTICDVFSMAKKCIDQTVGLGCGMVSADAITEMMPLKIAMRGPPIAKPCRFESSPTSGSSVLNASLRSLIIMASIVWIKRVI